MDIKQAYHILNVHEGASAKTIKTAYKKLVLKYHPDNHNTGNAEKFEEIVKAYYVVRYLSKGEISQAEFADTLHELRAKIISGERGVDHLEWWQKRNREIEEAQKEKKAKRIMGWWNAYGSKAENVDGVKESIGEKHTSSTKNDIGAEYDRAEYNKAEYRAESDNGTEVVVHPVFG